MILMSALLWVPASSLAGNDGGRDRKAERRQIAKLDRAARCIAEMHMGDDDMERIVERAIRAMLKELDPHSSYITAEQTARLENSMSGGFRGLGISTVCLRDTSVVSNVMAGSPAAAAGLRRGDRVVAVNGRSIVGVGIDSALASIRSATGKVRLDVARRGMRERLRFGLRRSRVPLPSVDAAYVSSGGVAYVRLARFGSTTPSELANKLRALGDFSSLIVDLRGNGGGVMSAALGAAGLFLPKGALIMSVDGPGKSHREYRNTGHGQYADIRMAVLIDENSASASEIFAGAMQDWGRAVIVGRKSFGKGLMQRRFMFDDGSSILLTISRYATPSGRYIQRPYVNGHADEYFENHRMRISVADDSDTLPKPEYRTLVKGRIVFGEDGISPDIATGRDTLYLTGRVLKAVGDKAFGECIFGYADSHRDVILARYPDGDAFCREFSLPDGVLSAACGGADAEWSAEERSGFENMAKAFVAGYVFSSSEYHKILNGKFDTAYEIAVRMLSQGA